MINLLISFLFISSFIFSGERENKYLFFKKLGDPKKLKPGEVYKNE